MRPWDLINALIKTSARNEKHAYLECLDENNEFWEFAKIALDPFVIFGLKALPKPDSYGSGVDAREFRRLVNDLTNRRYIGNAAKAAVKEFAERCTRAQWELWYSRVLEKDLDCGIGETTLNRLAPERWKFTLFSCQLATKIADARSFPSNAFLEAKYDGVRTLWFIKPLAKNDNDDLFEGSIGADVTCYSRSGRIYSNFSIITAQLAKLAEFDGFPSYGIVIDGEVLSKDFSTLMSQARRKTDSNFEGVLMAFDVIALPDFLEKNKTPPLAQRREVLEGLVEELQRVVDNPCVMISEAIKGVDLTTEDGEKLTADFFKQQSEAGFEGIVIKDATAPYQFERTTHWLKKKRGDTWDLEVIGTKEGRDRHAGRLGALIGRGTDRKTGEIFMANVGSGFSDKQRDEIWNSKETVIGKIIEVEGDEVTSNKKGSKSLRFPVFVRFRDDKSLGD